MELLGQVVPPVLLLLLPHQTSVHPDGVDGFALRTEIAATNRSPLTTPVGLPMVSVLNAPERQLDPPEAPSYPPAHLLRMTMGRFAVMLPPPPPPPVE
ncbi:MAG: hypothetical protein AUI83_02715 [Armatimonadetes bacterium 13_1_40CM_3_65_7]|nr:MAG: hypothetical protein AUI83_02715 [Armatimonadetes bacterium 13_1_40CM_3_65_7]